MKTIGEAGELAVVERIKKLLPENSDILVGAGDDCAVVKMSGNENLVLTSDPVIEGVHFMPGTNPADIGHKAVGRVLSDLAAMGATPRWLLINLVAPESILLSDIDNIYLGANEIASGFGAVIVGGDVAKGHNLELHVFGSGTVPDGKSIQRKGAVPGDFLFVTGALGGSITGGHLKFLPRVTEGLWLRDRVTSMMDISDGLASDLRRLLKMSNVGADIRIADIPIDGAVLAMNDDLTAIEHALYDGEDFELLFTVASSRKDEFCFAWLKEFSLPCTCIGSVTGQAGDIYLVDKNNRELLGGHGYEHFSHDGSMR